MAHDKQLSGYDFDFVEDPPDYLCCMIICNLPFRNPQLVNCCGARYCEPCIERWISEKGPQCPNCRAECRHMEDKSVEREVLSLKVRCSHGADCSWEGELRHLDKHLHTVHAAPAVVHAHVGKSKQEGRVNSVKEVKVKFWFWTWAVALVVLLVLAILFLSWLNMSEEGKELEKSVVDLKKERDTLAKERDALVEEWNTLNNSLQIIIGTGIVISVALFSYCTCFKK